MLTPAEESGLAGLRLAGRVQRAMSHLSDRETADMLAALQRGAVDRHLIYMHEGAIEGVRIMPAPLTMRPDQLAYVHSVSLIILNALRRLPDAYFSNFQIREALRVTPTEERWLLDCWGPQHRENNPIFGRLDATADFSIPMWKDSIKFVEPNLTGVGGLHYAPSTDLVVEEVVLPRLRAIDPSIRLDRGPDMRDLLVQELLDHLEVIGRPRGAIALLDPKYSQDGPDEQDRLAAYISDRHGVDVVHADPAELRLKGGEVYYKDVRVDVAYRDYTVLDIEELAGTGADIEPFRALFRQNRMVSSIAAELDQKSCWEVLTDPAIAQQYLTPEERQVVRRHILWTRLVSDRRTTDPRGESVDLLEFARTNHESLVLKPNRSFGGQGVVVGPAVTRSEWDSAIDTALNDGERWVLQDLASIPVREYPVLGPDGQVHQEPFYVVLGFAATRYGVGILARASQKQVVNVAQRGGMCATMIGNEAGR